MIDRKVSEPANGVPTDAGSATGQPMKASVPTKLGAGDMAMYAAIAGKAPQIDPNAGHFLEEPEPRSAHPWSPMVLSLYLREVYRQGALKINKPEIAAWIRKHSDTAMKRIHESQVRIHHSKNDRAA